MFNLSRFNLKTLEELYHSELTLEKYNLEDPILLEELIKEIKERKKSS